MNRPELWLAVVFVGVVLLALAAECRESRRSARFDVEPPPSEVEGRWSRC